MTNELAGQKLTVLPLIEWVIQAWYRPTAKDAKGAK